MPKLNSNMRIDGDRLWDSLMEMALFGEHPRLRRAGQPGVAEARHRHHRPVRRRVVRAGSPGSGVAPWRTCASTVAGCGTA